MITALSVLHAATRINMPEPTSLTFEIEFQPVGRRIHTSTEQILLAVAQDAGIQLIAVCGGMGSCDGCKVRLIRGKLSSLTLIEEAYFSSDELAQGLRLACQCRPLSNLVLEIPAESLSTVQRLQVEGLETPFELAPDVRALHFECEPPSLHDLQADTQRLADTLKTSLTYQPQIDTTLLGTLSERLRTLAWQGWAILSGSRVVEISSEKPDLLGLAVDIGTTKIAAYLVDLETGQTLAREGCMNPQIAYGEDLISRIHYCNQNPQGRLILQKAMVETLNQLIEQMCTGTGTQSRQIYEAVIVGNTAMHHIFAGLPVRQLGHSPYVPAVSEPLDLDAAALGLTIHPAGRVFLPPNIAGFVGADHVSMLAAIELDSTARTTLAIDIGTNTEISLKIGDQIYTCSCASGPAFEGAHISCGMRAAPGAIERVSIRDAKIRFNTLGEQPPVGICGSGILDAVAELLWAGAINASGSLLPGPLVTQDSAGSRVLFPPVETGSRVSVNRSDINEIQLAKGAIRTGIEILLETAGVTASEIEQVLIAGAFGTYLSVESAVKVGMFPNLPRERFRQVGNAAGSGACRMLLSRKTRASADALARSIKYVELTTHKKFSRHFSKAILFQPPTSKENP